MNGFDDTCIFNILFDSLFLIKSFLLDKMINNVNKRYVVWILCGMIIYSVVRNYKQKRSLDQLNEREQYLLAGIDPGFRDAKKHYRAYKERINEHIQLKKVKEIQSKLQKNLRFVSNETEKDEKRKLAKMHNYVILGNNGNTGKSSKSKPGGNEVLSRMLPRCEMQLVETVPEPLIAKGIKSDHMSSYDAFIDLIDSTEDELCSMSQWAITGTGNDKNLFKHLASAVSYKNVSLKIAYNNHHVLDEKASYTPMSLQTMEQYRDQVQVHAPSIEGKITPGHKGNMIHSKLYVSDKKHFYVGSANIGSRCTTRTKEIGILAKDCILMAKDILKQWQVYFEIENDEPLPEKYNPTLNTRYNADAPLTVFNVLDGTNYEIFLGASPKELCPEGRSDDLEAILHVIDSATEFIHIFVGEYIPQVIYKYPKQEWKLIDDQIRQAIQARNVKVKILVNDHATHYKLMKEALKSLMADHSGNVEAKKFDSQFDKRNFHGCHNKFMVTDISGFIGTSNWSGDYFTDTAGISFVFKPISHTNIRKSASSKQIPDLLIQLQEVFNRDWNSQLALKIY